MANQPPEFPGKPNRIEEIFPNIFRMEIPLPNSPLKAVNSYVIRGADRCLLIDTAMNRPGCKDAILAGLASLGVDLDQTDFFITHLHTDHFGLVSELAGKSTTVYFNRPDALVLGLPDIWERFIDASVANGFPEGEILSFMPRRPGRLYDLPETLSFTLLGDGDRLSIGEYDFVCVETKGHTLGHLCLYEPRTKILFAGDHILEDITPNITAWHEHSNPLQLYLDSLDKVRLFDISWVLPGHRGIFRHCRERIDQLKEHHDLRAREILAALNAGPLSAFEVASRITWDVRYDTWGDFPAFQKWFATGETLSHLIYLLERHEIVRKDIEGRLLYSLN